jgi:cobalt-zinc-cadmium efflux system outer membrane protein
MSGRLSRTPSHWPESLRPVQDARGAGVVQLCGIFPSRDWFRTQLAGIAPRHQGGPSVTTKLIEKALSASWMTWKRRSRMVCMLPKTHWTRAWLIASLGLATGCATSRSRAVTVEHSPSPSAFVFTEAERGTGERTLKASEPESVSQVSHQAAVDDQKSSAPDEPHDATSISLMTLEQWALASNPAIQQASASAYKAMGFCNQVGMLPNPTVGFFGEQIADAQTDQYGAFVNQNFILGDKLRLNQNVLSHGVQAQLWEVEAQRRRVITDVRVKFYEALAAQQRVDVATDFGKVLTEGVRVAEVRKQVAEGTQSEILLARIQRTELEVLQKRAGISYDAAWNELAATVGIRNLSPTPLERPAPVQPEQRNWESVYQDLVARSPELKAANARICRAAANVQRQRAQPIPNVEVMAGVGHDLATDQQFGRVQAGVGLPVYNKNQGNIAAAEAEYCRAQQGYRRIQLSLRARLARVAKDYDSAKIALERYEQEIVPQAQENLKLTEQGYAAGEFGFLEALTARRVYFQASLELIDARRDVAQATAMIDGLLLTGGLDDTVDTSEDDGLRGQSLDSQ